MTKPKTPKRSVSWRCVDCKAKGNFRTDSDDVRKLARHYHAEQKPECAEKNGGHGIEYVSESATGSTDPRSLG